MEFTIAWFWALKLLMALITIYTAYIAFISKKFKSKVWNIIAGLLILLGIVMPVKIDGTNSTEFKTQQERHIEASKELPAKVTADNWKKINVNGITKEDLK